jgi:DNA-directed RNA polymerase subunit RPC12/RpoP
VKLNRVFLCIDCEEIFDVNGVLPDYTCPSCTGRSIVRLSKWIASINPPGKVDTYKKVSDLPTIQVNLN